MREVKGLWEGKQIRERTDTQGRLNVWARLAVARERWLCWAPSKEKCYGAALLWSTAATKSHHIFPKNPDPLNSCWQWEYDSFVYCLPHKPLNLSGPQWPFPPFQTDLTTAMKRCLWRLWDMTTWMLSWQWPRQSPHVVLQMAYQMPRPGRVHFPGFMSTWNASNIAFQGTREREREIKETPDAITPLPQLLDVGRKRSKDRAGNRIFCEPGLNFIIVCL